MPGVVATIAVKQGQKIKAGDPLFTIEAMKMETSQHATIDGVVEEVLIQPGGAVEAKDLIIVIKQEEGEAAVKKGEEASA
jgi:pyruvate carboxylase